MATRRERLPVERDGDCAPSWRRAARGYLLLPHLVPVLVVELATLGFAVVAWDGLPPGALLAPLLLGMLGGQLAIGATNELVDLPYDRAGKPGKPLPSGDVSVRGARGMVIGGLTMMVGFGLPLGLPAFGLLALGTGLGVAYDLWLKQTVWSWLPYLLALPLLPVWVFVALGRPEPRLLFLYPLGALAAAGVHFAQALPDVAIDRQAGMETATSRLGSRATFALAWIATVSAPLLALGAARWLGLAGPFDAIVVAAVTAALFLLLNLAMLAANRRLGVTACFPLVALSTLASGLAWTWTVAR
jgi:4-hydroxybenzoate polyprenyltransferase